jgi:putative resolvase
VHPQTAYQWSGEGTLPVPAVRVNQRSALVCPGVPAGPAVAASGLYGRVSSRSQREDLDRQVARLAAGAAGAGGRVVRVEAGAGVNGSRAKVRRFLADPVVIAVVVEHRGWLGRMTTELAGSVLWALGRRLVVLDDGEVADDLARDMVEVLTGFCARRYGRRPVRNRAAKAVGCAQRDIGPQAAAGGGGAGS